MLATIKYKGPVIISDYLFFPSLCKCWHIGGSEGGGALQARCSPSFWIMGVVIQIIITENMHTAVCSITIVSEMLSFSSEIKVNA